MIKHLKGEPEALVLRQAREAHLGERPKPRKPPKAYKYVEELAHLQFELIKLQEWVRLQGLKVVVIFEGRDAAGKGGAIKRITQSLNPRICGRTDVGLLHAGDRDREAHGPTEYGAGPARSHRD